MSLHPPRTLDAWASVGFRPNRCCCEPCRDWKGPSCAREYERRVTRANRKLAEDAFRTGRTPSFIQFCAYVMPKKTKKVKKRKVSAEEDVREGGEGDNQKATKKSKKKPGSNVYYARTSVNLNFVGDARPAPPENPPPKGGVPRRSRR